MSEMSLRQAPASRDYNLNEGIRQVLSWSAQGSLRQWMIQRLTTWNPSSALAKGVSEAGFLYDPHQDIIYSKISAWQHDFGYCYAYDKSALMIGYVFDCEPIFFRYGDKEWMLELWKGQYGLETGCEVGVYNRRDDDYDSFMQMLDATIGKREDGPRQVDQQHSRFYRCVNSDEYLRIAFRLFRNDRLLLARGPQWHWWLTGFRWGVLSRPEELILEVSLGFNNSGLLQACITGLQQAGYSDLHIAGTTISFIFDKPHSYQPRMGYGTLVSRVLSANKALVDEYSGLGLPSNDPNQIESELGKRVSELGSNFLQNGSAFYMNALGDMGKLFKDIFGIP